MKRKLKLILEKWFSGFMPYQALMGGVRYYKATSENPYKPSEFLHYGKNVRLERGVTIAAPERLHVGDYVGIGQNVAIQAVGGCYIGKGCAIASETIIITTEHTYTGGETLPFDLVRFVKPVYIEDYVWIGTRVTIAPGVRIGEGAIVGMGSIVLQDVPPLAIVAGNPAKVVMYRSKPEFDRVKNGGAMVDPYKELPLLKVPAITKRKYKNELKAFGFDLSAGHDLFRYDKFAKLGERLKPVADRTRNGE
jgi:acetyltransferase-like isoleucine patch superfamily enzyme